MMPCEPAAVAPPPVAPKMVAPPPLPKAAHPLEALPPSPPIPEDDAEPQSAGPPAPPAPPAAAEDDPPVKPVTTIRFLDETEPPAKDDDTVMMAVVRRGGSTTGTAADIRAAVDRVCHGKVVACQTEVAGERQVRVTLTVHTVADWQKLYERLQRLPELGEYGLLIEARTEKVIPEKLPAPTQR
jgi:hypothetical protein